jgi:hypothetical protein
MISEEWAREDLGDKIQAAVADAFMKNSGIQPGGASK